MVEAKQKILKCTKRGCKVEVAVDANVDGELRHPTKDIDEHYVHLGMA